MTREELREHCKKEIEMCEFWAIGKGEKPSGKIYEEHKLILELLEQETVPRESYEHEYFLRKEFELKIAKLERQLKALKQEPSEDCISRQTAQNKIKKICNKYGLSYEDGERKPSMGGSAYALGHAFDDLPSVTQQENYVNIPYLMHKEMDIPISECQKAYDVAIDYLRSQTKVKG